MSNPDKVQNDVVTIYPTRSLSGTIVVPGDKSITHRAILFGMLASGTTIVDNWLDAGDCRSSMNVARQLGAHIEEEGTQLRITGISGQLTEPSDVLDCGNSGTTIRLFMGALAAKSPFACVTGDSSLRRRPMDRVMNPLGEMGAQITARAGRYAPLAVKGARLKGITYRLPVASAQVKSAVLIAGLLAESGDTTVIEREPSRDHTENFLNAFGANIKQKVIGQETHITVAPSTLRATRVAVPGDISSAAFLLAAAAIVPGSTVTVQGVGVNPTRIGFLRVLERMGVSVLLSNEQTVAGEAIADITVTGGNLEPVAISAEEIPILIDEIPIIGVLAAYAKGRSTVRGASELRVKETDRIRALVEGLQQIGVTVEEHADGFTIDGTGKVRGGGVRSFDDHRIAMSFAVAGLTSASGIRVDGWGCVGISFPTFLETLAKLGVNTVQIDDK